MKFKTLFAFLLCFAGLSLNNSALSASGKIKIVTTTSTFASIAKDIAGDKADVYFIASPNRDIHFISPTPKDVMKVKNTDVLIHAGLDLEVWRAPLLDAVGRLDLMWPTGEKQIDVSKGISLLEVPTNLSRAQGDIHAYGNPHYWLDPLNGRIIAENIAEGLGRLYPKDATFFRKNAHAFQNKIENKMKDWENEMSCCKGAFAVTYHHSWPYFMERFGLDLIGDLEPKPGIPPTAKHLEQLIRIMKEKGAKVIIKEVFNESRTPDKLARETGASVLTLFSEVGESKEGADYFSLFDYDVRLLKEAMQTLKKNAHE